jgi:hypothetical protein
MENNTFNTTEGLIDLHIHTNYSSNTEEYMNLGLYPKDLLREIKGYTDKFGCHASFSITDHDNIKGAKEIFEIIKNDPEKYKDITFVTGCEFTVSCESLRMEESNKVVLDSMHLLGYNFDVNDKVLNFYSNMKSLEKGKYFSYGNACVPYGNIIIAGKNYLNKAGLKFSLSDFIDFQLKTGEDNLYIENVNRFYDYCENKLTVDKPILDRLYIHLLGLTKNFPNKEKITLNDVNPINIFINNKIDVKEMIGIIENAGGVAVLAHPNILRLSKYYYESKKEAPLFIAPHVTVKDKYSLQKFIDSKVKAKKNFLEYIVKNLTQDVVDPITGEKLKGLVGLELLHSTGIEQNFFSVLTDLVEKYNLYATGGSDKHGNYKDYKNHKKELIAIGEIMPSSVEEIFPKLDKKKALFTIFGCKFIDDITENRELERKYGNYQIDMLSRTPHKFGIFDYANIKRFVQKYGIQDYGKILKKRLDVKPAKKQKKNSYTSKPKENSHKNNQKNQTQNQTKNNSFKNKPKDKKYEDQLTM